MRGRVPWSLGPLVLPFDIHSTSLPFSAFTFTTTSTRVHSFAYLFSFLKVNVAARCGLVVSAFNIHSISLPFSISDPPSSLISVKIPLNQRRLLIYNAAAVSERWK